MASRSQLHFVSEVTEETFQKEVIEKSASVPVLVDFWASWCGPCHTLSPILEKLADENCGAFILAKVDTEANPDLAMQFRVQSIPNVMLFQEGRVVDQFVGAYPESSIREFLNPYCPSEVDKLFALAEQNAQAGKNQEAGTHYTEVLRLDPLHSGAHLGLARLCIDNRKPAGAREHIESIPATAKEYEAAGRLKEVLAFQQECESAGGESACRKKTEQDPKDLDARFGLACCLASSGQYREALEEFLTVIARNKRHRDEAARKAMLAIFSLIGERSEMADEYRSRLARTLY